MPKNSRSKKFGTSKKSKPNRRVKPGRILASDRKKESKPSRAMKPKRLVAQSNGKPVVNVKRTTQLAKTCAEMQALQRMRASHLKSRNMMHNRLRATVAGTLGYYSGMEKKDREKILEEASKEIRRIVGGGKSEMKALIMAGWDAVQTFEEQRIVYERKMLELVKELSVVDWVERKEQRGFGLKFLAIVIGETGDLANYAAPGKVWRRFGCAPFTSHGKTLMGATWRKGREGKLHAEEWEEFGYSPRRRSIAYLIGEGLMKQNFISDRGKVVWVGPYRKRYEHKKSQIKELNPSYSKMRCHRHGMLLAAKLLLKNLWIQWNPDLAAQFKPDW